METLHLGIFPSVRTDRLLQLHFPLADWCTCKLPKKMASSGISPCAPTRAAHNVTGSRFSPTSATNGNSCYSTGTEPISKPEKTSWHPQSFKSRAGSQGLVSKLPTESMGTDRDGPDNSQGYLHPTFAHVRTQRHPPGALTKPSPVHWKCELSWYDITRQHKLLRYKIALDGSACFLEGTVRTLERRQGESVLGFEKRCKYALEATTRDCRGRSLDALLIWLASQEGVVSNADLLK